MSVRVSPLKANLHRDLCSSRQRDILDHHGCQPLLLAHRRSGVAPHTREVGYQGHNLLSLFLIEQLPVE